MRASSFVLPLRSDAASDQVGGKAANLARLLALGMPVPDGFVIVRNAFDRFVTHNRLDAALAEHQLELDDPDSFARAAADMQRRVDAAELPGEVCDELARAWTGEGAWIVRSSAVGEDSSADSFAGQLDSVLDVRSLSALERALRTCWGSYWSARALFYQRARGRRLQGMGVVVQRMIDPAMGGVLFTRSPTDVDAIAIEYVHGHPAGLVSGALDPERLRVDRRTLAAPPPFDRLVELGLQLERELGRPQDVEWVIDRSNKLWLVQSRAITTLAPSTPQQVFSNVNVNENYPRPMSPLLYSIALEAYENYFRNLGRLLGVREDVLESLEIPLRYCVGVHGARLYYNLSNIHRCIRAAPYGAQLTAAFDAFVGVDDEGRTSERTRLAEQPGPSRPLDLARVAWVSARSFRSVETRLRRFEARVDEYAARTRELEAASVEQLLEHFRSFLHIRFRQWADASLADLAATLAFAWLKWTLGHTLGPEPAKQLPQSLLLAIPNVVSSGPVDGLWDLSRVARADAELCEAFSRLASSDPDALLARIRAHHPSFSRALDEYLHAWGFRISGELMLTTQSYVERPAALLPLLAPYIALDGPSPREATKVQARRRDEAIAEVHRGIPLRWRLVFDRALQATQQAIGYRERARLKQALLYSRFRAVVHELGRKLRTEGRLERPDDLLFLRWREIDEWLSGHAMFPASTRELIELRRREHAALSEQHPPDTVRLPIGHYLDGSLDSNQADADTDTLIGVGVAGGRVTGTARVMTDLSEQASFERGDCLVTRQTDPGWAPLFFLAKGLVMERGGMLSHGAIVAREFGIPGVIAVPDATRLLRSGETIEIDGDRGRVRRVRSA